MSQVSPFPGSPQPASFLGGGSTMGELIRTHPWTTTLGPPERWPQSLRTVVRLMLTTEHPMFLFWGPDLICLYNDAFISLIGPELHPRMLGARGREVWHATWDVLGPQIDLVMSGKGATWRENQRLPLFRHGGLDEAYFTYSYSPIDEETAPDGVGGALVICAETTQEVLLGKHQAFRLQLEAVLRTRSIPAEIVTVSTRMLGEFLEASRCCYVTAETGGDFLLVQSDWTNATTPRLGSRLHRTELGRSFLAWHRNEQTIPVEDPSCTTFDTDSRKLLSNHSDLPPGVAAPLVKNGRLVAALCIYPGGQLRWTEKHRALIRDVAERIWEAVDHASAAAERELATMAMRKSEARYRSLVEASAAMIWEIPASGECVTPQAGWSAYTGQTFEQLRGWGWLNAVHPDDQDRTTEALGRAFEAQANFELQYRLRSRDGQYRPMLVRAVTMTNPDGSLQGWIGMCTRLDP